MKYILLPAETPLIAETPILFPGWLSHKTVADALAAKGLPRPVSAGFVDFDETGPVTYGESDSLGLAARHGDEIFVEVAL